MNWIHTDIPLPEMVNNYYLYNSHIYDIYYLIWGASSCTITQLFPIYSCNWFILLMDAVLVVLEWLQKLGYRVRNTGAGWQTWLSLSIQLSMPCFRKYCILKICLDNSLGRVGGEYSGVWQRQKVVHTTISFSFFRYLNCIGLDTHSPAMTPCLLNIKPLNITVRTLL